MYTQISMKTSTTNTNEYSKIPTSPSWTFENKILINEIHSNLFTFRVTINTKSIIIFFEHLRQYHLIFFLHFRFFTFRPYRHIGKIWIYINQYLLKNNRKSNIKKSSSSSRKKIIMLNIHIKILFYWIKTIYQSE
jgi:hypothetical protein